MDRTGRSARRRATAALAAGTLLLTGCSQLGIGGSDPTPTLSAETVAPTPKASPSPTLPAGAKKATRSGGEAFVKYWFSAYNHATWSLNSAELAAISDAKCEFCNRAKKTTDNMKAATNRPEGGRITITEATVTLGTPTKGIRVDLVYDQAASTVVASDGSVVANGTASKGAKMIAAAKWTGKKWVMLEVVLMS